MERNAIQNKQTRDGQTRLLIQGSEQNYSCTYAE